MRISPRIILGLLLTAAVSSCAIDSAENPPETAKDNLFTPGEEKAVATFNGFLDQLNGDPQTRSTVMGDARITSIRQTSTSAYLGGGAETRSGESGMPVYELTLTNPDSTTGFAVVADPETVDQVIAYAPLGSIADTVFNKGMAMYFQELAALADAVDRARQQYEQENAQQPATWNYGPVETLVTGAFVPTKWGQGNPYNNLKAKPRESQNFLIGCYTIAIGQIMAYHKYPATYNWDLLTATETIPATPTTFLGIS